MSTEFVAQNANNLPALREKRKQLESAVVNCEVYGARLQLQNALDKFDEALTQRGIKL